jgi:hypothetical protein
LNKPDHFIISAVLLIIGLIGVISIALAGATSQEAAAWVQALGAVAAIAAAWLTVIWQQRKSTEIAQESAAREIAERDRRRRAVIYRLTPLFYDISVNIERAQESLTAFSEVVSMLKAKPAMLEHVITILTINAMWDESVYLDLHLCDPETTRTTSHILYATKNYNFEVRRVLTAAVQTGFAKELSLPINGKKTLDGITVDLAKIVPEITTVLSALNSG